jgi:KH domain
LCSRDAKFAVDCDTCRLSYCLVCLASGSKDPCVRCGHRPSKRMEQLVHLRLKSIYKAFKSSSNKNKNKSDGGDSKGGTPSNAAMASAAAANAKQQQQQNAARESAHHGHHGHGHGHHHHSHHGPRRNKPTTLQDMVGDDDEDLDGDDDDNDNMMMMGNVLPAKFCHDLEQNFLAEQKKADAAAEALLAELEEEEEANAKKKSKKNKKKKRKQSQKETEEKDDSPDEPDAKEKDKNEENTEKDDSDADSNDRDASPIEDLPQEMEEDEEDEAAKMDPVEKEMMEYVESGYVEGIEDILFRLKGIPGKAVLRKNAKKALKRLRAEMELMETAEADFEPVPESKPRQSSTSSPPKTAGGKSSTTPAGKLAHRSSSIQSTTASANKNETFVPIASTLVGWVIGKGGQRIRDMMEASGAKIWVDQEKVKGQPTRNVFISGDKRCVELGFELVKEVLANAPPPPGSAPSSTNATALAGGASTPMPTISSAIDSSLTPAQRKAWEAATGNKPQTMADRVRESAGDKNADPTLKPSDSQHIRASTPGNDAASGILTEVVSCETRFVPLLIGKRGWTIKNIQDESGARVDIDQTVTPRQVRISGSRANVEKALNMVRDVLSYPHAQLQHGSEELEFIAAADGGPDMIAPLKAEDQPPSPTKEKLLAASARLEKETSRKEVESPPPVVGDARSAISASSSLSSTPEPSMASSAKGALASQQLQAQLNNGPLIAPLPQPFEVPSGSIPSNTVPSSFHHSEMALKTIGSSEEYGASSDLNASQLYRNSSSSDQVGGLTGRIGMPQGTLPEASHLQSSHLQSQQGFYGSAAPKSAPSPMNHGILPPHQRHYQQSLPSSQQVSSNYGPSGQIPRQVPGQMGGSSQYNYSAGMNPNPRGYPVTTGRSLHSSYSNEAASLIATTPLRDLMGRSMNRGAPPAAPQMRSSGYRGNGNGGGAAGVGVLWNSGHAPYPSSGNMHSANAGTHRGISPAHSSSFTTRSAGYSSQHQHHLSHDAGLASGMGYDDHGLSRSHQNYQQQAPSSQLPYSNPRESLGGNSALHGTPSFPVAPAPAARSSSLPPTDDSIMLESLFGTVPAPASSNETGAGSLLAGLNSLSLGGDAGAGSSTGLWGPSSLTDTWAPAAGNEKQSNPGISSLGDILSGPMPSLQLDKSQESRFQWK